MGVPALFRWLSKKYPKIVQRVVEDTPSKVLQDGGDVVEVPIKYESKNPNGFEVDNLYLDMNGIVHPCTHPEGKPAPETEEEMMVEIFNYTERVVNMTRPRKVLMMAIDGVAPRAKMNQQRSRRFRAAQEAADKEEERKEAIKMYEAMGHTVSDETRNKRSWDSNAITPGTPFMDLLSNSLKYWVSYKLSTDPGWKDLKIIISDSSVPGEGEHKIVDWIRRQRSYPDWDPNTSHVMYGLDADLIMLSLATHEPHFRVLREDVFFQGNKGPNACKNCGETGHFAANCKGEKAIKDPTVVEKAKPVDPKPFIFLDVSVLREYLAVELVVPGCPFPFDLELAIDDWIFMIFFVGNDFLPHLPSLEIREGAIDVLLKIWRSELPRMGGYLTNHGKVDLARAGIILEGLAKSEDEIFQKRKEDEERQDQRSKRMRIEDHRRQDEAKARRESGVNAPVNGAPGTMTMNGTEYVAVTPSATARGGPLHPSLPTRPGFDTVPKEEVQPKGKKMTPSQREAAALNAGKNALLEAQASNKDIVENRRKIRMANLSAAQLLKAELAGEPPASASKDGDDATPIEVEVEDEEKEEMTKGDLQAIKDEQGEDEGVDEDVVAPPVSGSEDVKVGNENEIVMDGDEDIPIERSQGTRGRKRKVEEREEEDDEDEDEEDEDDTEAPPDVEADQPVSKKKLKVNPDGTVEGYVDDVRLWEPGYRERYYQSKFGVPVTDTEFINKVTKCYMEGLCWVLEYYYQGVPAWDWYYPYHYAPFAQDFKDVGNMKIKFEVAQPFKPFAQLLGVFPAASRKHLPEPLQGLMINEDSPILDFYPDDFEIDMNGKKMAWQGVALLPFIDQTRLLDALGSKEEQLSDDEKRRNRWGDNVMFVAETNRLYDMLCSLYTLKSASKPVPLDTKLSLGTNGSVLADPACVPNSAFDTPLPNIPECPDIENNQSISVRYYFPRQRHIHRSIILNGYRAPPPRLSESDKDWTRRGGQGGGHRKGPRHSGPSTPLSGPGTGHHGGDRGGNGAHRSASYPDLRGLEGHGVHRGPPSGYYTPPAQASYGGYGYGGGGAAYGGAAGGAGGYGGYGGNGGAGGAGGYGYGGASAYAAAPAPSYGRPPAAGGYGGYGGANGGYNARNPYGATPSPYGGGAPARPPFPPTNPPSGYGGRGGQGQGGYNPYGAQSGRRY